MEPFLEASDRLADLLARHDVRGALRYLNGLTAFRFTALYRFDNDQLSSRCFVDRMNPDVATTEDIPIEASYCIYVRQNHGPFLLADSLRDERVRGHRKQPTVRSYCGVPLIDARGWMFGSVCHFDFEPHPFQETDVLLLEEVAQLLVKDGQLVPAVRG
jgi:GAF domain-containing protein